VWVVAALGVGLFVSAGARADTLTVCPGGGCDFTTVAAAVAAAAATGDEVVVSAGTYTELNVPIANKTLTIRGAGAAQTILQSRVSNAPGTGTFRVFLLSGTTQLTLEDMTLRNGRVTSGDGGTIFGSSPARVTLRQCVLEDSLASQGGAISLAAQLVIEDSVIRRAQGSAGGAILLATGGSLLMTGSVIEQSTGTSGACVNAGAGVTTEIRDSILRNNSGSNAGVVIYSDGPVLLDNVEVSGNRSTSTSKGPGVLGFERQRQLRSGRRGLHRGRPVHPARLSRRRGRRRRGVLGPEHQRDLRPAREPERRPAVQRARLPGRRRLQLLGRGR
jgi:hypothetical protein